MILKLEFLWKEKTNIIVFKVFYKKILTDGLKRLADHACVSFQKWATKYYNSLIMPAL